jgi:malate synthase
VLFDFVGQEATPGSGASADEFWRGFAILVRELAPKNAALLRRREELQALIDAWHREHPGRGFDAALYADYLRTIGYLRAPGEAFTIDTAGVDAEIASIAGPQLVVPLDNARFALNAANARWGSLYDALYGTDALSHGTGVPSSGYDIARGRTVIAYVRAFLDECFPLTQGTHSEATGYAIDAGGLKIVLGNGAQSRLKDNHTLVGYQGEPLTPTCVLLIHNGLHVELRFDRAHPIGKLDVAGFSDVWLESAVTTIQDCEDSVAAVDAEDKVNIYRNWLGLMKGTLEAQFQKGGRAMVRRLNDDRCYRTPEGDQKVLPGRSLMLIRHVGSLLMTDAVTIEGRPIPESFVDAAVTTLIGLHDRKRASGPHNSRHGSIYVVKPKMHGPEEVAFACELFGRVESLLGLPANTLKMGIMDEERRTTVNLMK